MQFLTTLLVVAVAGLHSVAAAGCGNHAVGQPWCEPSDPANTYICIGGAVRKEPCNGGSCHAVDGVPGSAHCQ